MTSKFIKISLIGPNDAQNEMLQVQKYFNGINDVIIKIDLQVTLKHWTKTPQGVAQEEVQELITDDLDIENSDIVICIYSHSLGTKGNDEVYRTENELYQAINHYKKSNSLSPSIFVYFKEFLSVAQVTADRNTFQLIEDFKDKVSKDVLSKQYKGTDDLLFLLNNNFLSFIFEKKAKNLLRNENVTVEEGTEGYLTLLNELISKSKNEVLFTSTRMASTETNDIYGSLQKKIINESLELKNRNPDRVHFGVIDSGSQTCSGATELRANVKDIILRFNSNLNHVGVNFFISDEEFIVLRIADYSVSIKSKHLAIIFKRYFYYLWECSQSMKDHLNTLIDANHNTYENVLEFSQSNDLTELTAFIESLNDIDQMHQAVPYRFKEKIIFADTNTPVEFDVDSIKNIYTKYLDGCNTDLLNMEYINKIKKSIATNQPINYETLSTVFFSQYFLSNYYKVQHSLSSIKSKLGNSPINILDIGGGGGSSTLAIMHFMQQSNIDICKFDVVDYSEEQLLITRNITEGCSIEYNEYKDDAYSFLKDTELSYDFIVASNFLCEANSQNKDISLPKLLKKALRDSGYLLVIERTESGIYEAIEESSLYNIVSYVYQNKRFKLPIRQSSFTSSRILKIYEYIKTEYTHRYGLYRKQIN